jgi:NADH-quinone oxidoreductase subunit N
MIILITITAIGILAMLSEIFHFRKFLLPVVVAGLGAALGLAFMEWNTARHYYHDMMVMDNYAISFSVVMIGTTLLWFILSNLFLKNNSHVADYTCLILFALAGGIVMASFGDLTMLFIGLEILSISMYIMASANKSELRSNEAGFKYFMLGAFATGFLLFGIALIYGAAGTFNLAEIGAYTSANKSSIPDMFKAGILLMMIGLVFKVSAAPFHFWAPDVYEGAPSPVTAFMSTVVKTAAFAAFLRLFSVGFHELSFWWGHIIALFAGISMLLGNILAVYQQSLKRMLAYSSIAHAGYMLMAIAAMNQGSANALLLYTAAYSLGSIGIFALVLNMTNAGNESISSLKGFAAINKIPALIISVLMLSLAGIPPVAGFFAKYYMFTSAMGSNLSILVLVAVLSSLIGVYYYFRIIIAMYQPADRDSEQLQISPVYQLVLWVTLLGTLALGIYPSFFTKLI